MNTQTKLAQSAVLYECTLRTSNFTTIQQPGTWYQAHTRIKKVHEEESKAAGTWYLARYQVGVPVTWYQVMEGSPRNRYKVNYCLAEILRFF